MPVLARLEHIVKDFGAVRALDDVSLDINQGEVLGLMGDNGAGKSTLVKTIAGNFQPTRAPILIDGKPVHLRRRRPTRARTASRSSTRTWRCATI